MRRIKIGIPRALLYYWYGPAWQVFFQELGLTPLVSGPTGKAILDAGVKTAVDEVCLPVKVFLGHCLTMQTRCDRLLTPRYISVNKDEFICPKFMGLPEMTRQAVGSGRQLIWKSDQHCHWDSLKALPPEIISGFPRNRVMKSLKKAKAALEAYQLLMQGGLLPAEAEAALLQGRTPERTEGGPLIGLIGHPYCLYDAFINLGAVQLLQGQGFKVMVPEMFPARQITMELRNLSKPLFWTLGQRILGTFRLMWEKGVAGVVYLSAFACGPEALISEMVKRESKAKGLPLLKLDLDEHSGEAGFITRMEAFLDLLKRKRGYSCV